MVTWVSRSGQSRKCRFPYFLLPRQQEMRMSGAEGRGNDSFLARTGREEQRRPEAMTFRPKDRGRGGFRHGTEQEGMVRDPKGQAEKCWGVQKTGELRSGRDRKCRG